MIVEGSIFLLICQSFTIIQSHFWEERTDRDEELLAQLLERKLSPSELLTLIEELPQGSLSFQLKSKVWHDVFENHYATYSTRAEWSTLEPLIPFIPPEFLLTINFTEDTIEFFGKFEFGEDQLSVLADVVTRSRRKEIYSKEEQLRRMGNIFCGLSKTELKELDSTTVRNLLKQNFFTNIKGCSVEKLKLLSEKAQSHTVVGPPRAWEAHTVKSLGMLLGGLNAQQIRQIRSECFSEITPGVISSMQTSQLKELRREQLHKLTRSSLLAWRRKTMDLTPLYSDSPSRKPFSRLLTFSLVVLFETESLKHLINKMGV